jgi:hypothetical protein
MLLSLAGYCDPWFTVQPFCGPPKCRTAIHIEKIHVSGVATLFRHRLNSIFDCATDVLAPYVGCR